MSCVKHGYSVRFNKEGQIDYGFCPLCRIADLEAERKRDDILLMALMLWRDEPMTVHHIGALRERLGYISDSEIRAALAGKE